MYSDCLPSNHSIFTFCRFFLDLIFSILPRDAKRKLAKSAPKRDSISTESRYEKQARLKRGEMVKASKKRKLKLSLGPLADSGSAEQGSGASSRSAEPSAKKAKIDAGTIKPKNQTAMLLKGDNKDSQGREHVKKKKPNNNSSSGAKIHGNFVKMPSGAKRKKNKSG